MATKIDELIIQLKADIKSYNKNLKIAQKKAKTVSSRIRASFAKIKSATAKATAGIGNFKNGLVAAAGALGLGLIIKSSLDAADAMAKLGANTGINTDLLQELSFAASQTGVGQEALNASLLRFNRRIGEAQGGNKAYEQSFREMGVAVREANGTLRSTEDIFLDVAEAVKGIPPGAGRAKIAFDAFGLAGGQLVNLLAQGAEGIRVFQKQAQNLGIVLDKDVLKQAENVNDEFDKMRRVISAELTRAVVAMSPELITLAKTMISVTKVIVPYVKGLGAAIQRIKELFGATKTADRQLSDLVDTHDDLNDKLKSLIKTQARFAEGSIAWNQQAENIKKVNEQLEANLTAQQSILNQIDERMNAERALDQLFAERKTTKEETANAEAEATIKEIEDAQLRADLLAQIDKEKFGKEIKILKKTAELKEKINAKSHIGFLKLKAAEKKVAEDEDKTKRKRLIGQVNATSSFFSSTMALSKGNSEALFNLSKKLAKATALIQGVLAVQTAFANPPGPPFSIPQALAAAAQAAVNIARINATSFKKGIDTVPGTGNQGIPSIVHPGERVVPRETNLDLKALIAAFSGLIGGVNQEMDLQITIKPDEFTEFMETKLVERGVIQISETG